ncbi:hypothetical protein JSY36_10300 [Bacillus sp. H-16]|uniref:hypothetical protein n=1 Tax=Alteribacter salitolerans TaxID=2912333 RepID=UPI001963912B|nr:hypothetical protein [Alteribacter salitolerans]MBM7096148.1 hypothetical protein [Alteribacter salitolerans]
MKRSGVMILGLLILTGCSKDLAVTEVSMDQARKGVREFVQEVEGQGGAHLYEVGGKKEAYLFLTSGVVTVGEEASHFSNVKTESHGDTVTISFSREWTEDYGNDNLQYHSLYRITFDQDYDVIELYENESPSSFTIVGGE